MGAGRSGSAGRVGRPAVLVHGGAWAIPQDETDAHVDGLHRALARARQLGERGASALDIVTETVAVLEAHPAFDAGRGAVLDRDGRPQLDAGIMDGPTLAWGAVANVRTVAHPVRLARALAEGGRGALRGGTRPPVRGGGAAGGRARAGPVGAPPCSRRLPHERCVLWGGSPRDRRVRRAGRRRAASSGHIHGRRALHPPGTSRGQPDRRSRVLGRWDGRGVRDRRRSNSVPVQRTAWHTDRHPRTRPGVRWRPCAPGSGGRGPRPRRVG